MKLKVIGVTLLTWIFALGNGVEHHTRHSPVPCSTQCECTSIDRYYQTTQIMCRDRSNLGIQLPESLVILSYNNVTTPFLQASDLTPPKSSESNLNIVIYRQSKIRTISYLAFDKLRGLEILDLSENIIEDIPENTFRQLINLQKLNLSSNNLYVLPDKLFENLNDLTELYLSDNKLSSPPFKIIAPLTSLTHLDLSKNQISTIQGHTVSNRNLKTLLLNNNQIRDFPSFLLFNLKQLEYLDLSNNLLSALPDNVFKGLNRLKTLDLMHNNIKTISNSVFHELHHLLKLDLSENPIQSFHNEQFTANTELEVLELDNTQINILSKQVFSSFYRLKALSASHNPYLTTIDQFLLSHSPELQYLDISNNNLTRVPTFLPNLTNLKFVNMEENPWECNCVSSWFIQWFEEQNSTQTDLQCDGKNMFEAMRELDCATPPEAINTTSLEILRMRSNATLTCLFTGKPPPSITWVTPSGFIFHFNPNYTDGAFSQHPPIHLYDLSPSYTNRIKLLNNGSLYIDDVLRQDAGLYTCLASNPAANATAHIIVQLDQSTFYHIKIMSIIVGGSCAGGFLLLTGIGHLIYWIIKK